MILMMMMLSSVASQHPSLSVRWEFRAVLICSLIWTTNEDDDGLMVMMIVYKQC